MNRQAYLTARTAWGPVEVPYRKSIELFGIPGFAVHRQITPNGLVPNYYVISHIETGFLMPGLPKRTPKDAIRNCHEAMAKRHIDQSVLLLRLKDLAGEGVEIL